MAKIGVTSAGIGGISQAYEPARAAGPNALIHLGPAVIGAAHKARVARAEPYHGKAVVKMAGTMRHRGAAK